VGKEEDIVVDGRSRAESILYWDDFNSRAVDQYSNPNLARLGNMRNCKQA